MIPLNFFNIFRLQLRQERFRLLLWSTILVLMSIGVIGSYMTVVNDAETLAGMMMTMRMPSMTALCGPVWTEGTLTIGSLYGIEMTLWMGVVIAIMNIFMVVRYTRGDEESGNMEMLKAFPVGRTTPLLVTLKMAGMANVLIGVLTAVGIGTVASVQNIESMSWLSAFNYGAVFALFGWLFAVVAAIMAQITASARSAITFSGGLLGALYIARAVTDIEFMKSGTEPIGTYLNPVGLLLRAKPFVDNQFWPIGAVFGLSLILAIFVFYLNSVRDLGQSFIPDRAGKKRAATWTTSAFGMSLRLQRAQIIGWLLALFLLSIIYGSILNSIEDYIGGNEMFTKMLKPQPGHSITEMFIGLIISVMALFAVVPALNITLRPLREELKGRIENVYSRSVGRIKFLMVHIVISYITGAVMLLSCGVGLYIAAATTMADPISLVNILKYTMIYYPALLVVAALGVFATGIGTRNARVGAYCYFGYCYFAIYFGELLDLPEWMKKLTPFAYLPQLMAQDMDWIPVIVISSIAVGLTLIGCITYRRRNLA
jgi:ABC-2 type transport system permease protein